MFTWDGVLIGLQAKWKEAADAAKARKNMLFIIAAVFAVGIILFIRKK